MHVRLTVFFAVSRRRRLRPWRRPRPRRPRYTIQVSDVVALVVSLHPEFDFAGPVQPDGYITAPLLGAIRIVGLTVEIGPRRGAAEGADCGSAIRSCPSC